MNVDLASRLTELIEMRGLVRGDLLLAQLRVNHMLCDHATLRAEHVEELKIIKDLLEKAIRRTEPRE